MEELVEFSKKSSQSNQTIWFGHFTTSTIMSPSPGIRTVMGWDRSVEPELVISGYFPLLSPLAFLKRLSYCLCCFILFVFCCVVPLQLICVGTSIRLVGWCLFCTPVTSQARWNLRWETGKTTEGEETSLQGKLTQILLKIVTLYY